MIAIAVVEDDAGPRDALRTYLERSSSDIGEPFAVAVFSDGESFLAGFNDQYDLVILDIQLGGIDGMEVAERMRARGSSAVIVFVTNLASYAIRGYSVQAFDYVMKPVSYQQFLGKVRRAIGRIRSSRSGTIQIHCQGMRALSLNEILYVEVKGRKTVFHMVDGTVLESREAISEIEKRLPATSFFRCHVSIIVNARYVGRIGAGSVSVQGDELPVARSKKAMFLNFMTLYWGESI